MSFNWNEYFILAADLSNVKTDEAKVRSAISRSYYSAYNLAKAYLRENNGYLNSSDHKDMWNQFTVIDGKRQIQTWGDRARLIRNNADYDDTINNLESKLRMAMMNAQYIINLLEK